MTKPQVETLLSELAESRTCIETKNTCQGTKFVHSPVTLGRVLELIGIIYSKVVIDADADEDIAVESRAIELLKLWQPCGFSSSLNQIVNSIDFNSKNLDNDSGYRLVVFIKSLSLGNATVQS